MLAGAVFSLFLGDCDFVHAVKIKLNWVLTVRLVFRLTLILKTNKEELLTIFYTCSMSYYEKSNVEGVKAFSVNTRLSAPECNSGIFSNSKFVMFTKYQRVLH